MIGRLRNDRATCFLRFFFFFGGGGGEGEKAYVRMASGPK